MRPRRDPPPARPAENLAGRRGHRPAGPGGFTVDIKWWDGTVADHRITSPTPREVRVTVRGETITVTSRATK